MSEQAPERPAAGGGRNLLANKVGPLATWVWLLIATVLVIVIAMVMKARSSSATSASSTAPGTTANASQVPDIILQDYGSPVTQTVTTPPPGSVPPAPPPATTPPPTKTKPTPVSKTPVKSSVPPKTAPPSEPIFNGSYSVKKGQTLEEVAKQFGITREQLAHANGVGTGAGLRTGQVLKVPSPAPGGKPNKAK
jgi:LysM repeat protein